MEKAVQAFILKNSKIISKAANMYARKNKGTSYEDLFQEGMLYCLSHWQKFQDFNTYKIWDYSRKGIREYLRKYLGVQIEPRFMDKRGLGNAVSVDFQNEEEFQPLKLTTEQPLLEEKQLLEKIHDVALKILTAKQYIAVYSDRSKMTTQEKNRQYEIYTMAISKLKKHAESVGW